jgi:sugar/nucleoside kinase (ribokinase family)
VEGQRLMQAHSDILLGWQRTVPEGKPVDYYLRQLRDWKGSLELAGLDPNTLAAYADLCGWNLARAHARSGDRVAITGYLGKSDMFDQALASFASAYADKNQRDYGRLRTAAKSGRITAEHGL